MMHFFAERMKIVVEPTGCLAAAAVRRESQSLRGQRIGVIVSGGNVDLTRFASLIMAAADKTPREQAMARPETFR